MTADAELDITTDATLSVVAGESVDPKRRTITGTILTFGTLGSPSTGPTIFLAGSLDVDNPQRVKLLVDHDHTSPIGYATEIWHDTAAAYATFYVPESELGSRMLAEAAAGLRDAFSVGCRINDYGYNAKNQLVVKSASLYEVSLLAVPAYAGATVSEVHAAQNRNTMDEDEKTTPPATQKQTTPPATQKQASKPAAKMPNTKTRTVKGDTVTAGTTAQDLGMEPQAGQPFTIGALPGTDLASLEAAYLSQLADPRLTPAQAITAALVDVIPADYPGDANGIRPQYVGELWKASLVERPMVDAFTTKKLEALKVYGYKRTTGFVVDKWAGNKTAIPSGKGNAGLAETEAQRFAGGQDIDRAFIDFKVPGFLAAVLEEAMDEYKKKTEAFLTETVVAQASSIPYAASLTAALGQLGITFAKLGANLGVVQFASDVWAEFIDMPASQAPWWLQRQGSINLGTVSGEAGGLKLALNNSLPAGKIMGADRRAVTFYEAPTQRVQALDVKLGGIDVALYGYAAALVNDPRAVVLTGVTETVA